jgi:transcriptional/translational regulatory protein YebC/TACO1
MASWKQKYGLSVHLFKKAGLCLLMGSTILVFSECSIIQTQGPREQSDKVNKRIKRKRAKEYQQAREKFLEAHYNRQAPRVQKRMDYNAARSKKWREKHLPEHNASLFERIKNWFRRFFRWFDPPEKGLFN